MCKLKNYFLLLISVLLLTFSFFNNTFSVVDQEKFSIFQQDSESLVISRIVADELNLTKNSKANLYIPLNSNEIVDYLPVYKMYQNNFEGSGLHFVPYFSQYGFQGDIFSFLSKRFRLDLDSLHIITSLLLSITLIILTNLYIRIIGGPFAISFFICVLLSPWLVCFARNLYWMTFSWFLPSIIALFLLDRKTKFAKILVCIALIVAFAFKCLCGYEYISSIILFAAVPFLFKYVMSLFEGKNITRYLSEFFIVCICGVGGFLIALLMHASIRSDDIWQGLISIYKFDVLRRTYGSEDQFVSDPLLVESLRASLYSVIQTYIFSWKTLPLLPYTGYSPYNFPILCAAGILSSILIFKKGCKKYLILILLFSTVPLSWIILAKAHSYVHTHMNFVLWYLGFVPALISSIYVLLSKPLRNLFYHSDLKTKSTTKF